jgi:hypothetical protein
MVLAGAVISSIDFAYQELISSFAFIPMGLFLAFVAAIVGFKAKPVISIPAFSPIAQTDYLDKLIKLKGLLDSGAITRDEFEVQKQVILFSEEKPERVTAPEGPPNPAVPVRNERPSGVTIVSAYYVLSGILALVTVPFGFMLSEYLGSSGLNLSPLFSSLLCLQVVLVLIPFILAYGLLRGVNWVRVLVRIVTALAVVGSLISLVLAAMFVPALLSLLSNIASQFNQMVAANPPPPELITTTQIIQLVGEIVSLGAVTIYGVLGIEVVTGVVIPAAIFYYLGRRNVKAFFSKSPSSRAVYGE